jgi:hypothetical protein
MRSVTLGVVILLLSLTACSSDQIQHLRDTKKIAVEAANWEVKRIMPADLLRATRWAGDSLTGFADRELHQMLTAKLQEGGVAAALPYCRPETYASTDSLARILKAKARRVSNRPRNPQHQANLPATQLQPDTARLVARATADLFTYQRPIVLNDALCLRCHGTVGTDITTADYALIKKNYPSDRTVGYRQGEVMGAWQVELARPGVAEFYTMKTRKVMKPRRKLF